MKGLYSVMDFIYWLEKNNNDFLDKKEFTHSQIATIIAKAMINFFDETETDY